MAEISFGEYLQSLGTSMLASYGVDRSRVQLHLDVDVTLGLREAIPSGLIVQELLSNSLKHAFPDGRRGEIRLGLHRQNGELRLVYTDDGVGFGPGLDLRQARSLGLQLIGDLAAQLHGTVSASGEAGARFEITLREKE
jgi:two-component sensor histidine kinase